MNAKINIIGFGIMAGSHLTRQGIEVIKNSHKSYYLGNTSDKDVNKLHKLGLVVENITYLYNDGDVDDNNYNRIYNFLVQSALSLGEICLLVPGHPS